MKKYEGISQKEIRSTRSEQTKREDTFERSAKLTDQIYDQASSVIDKLYSTKVIPGQSRQLLDQKYRDKLKQEVHAQIIDLRNHHETAIERVGWATRHAILKRFYGPEQSVSLRDIWKSNGEWAKISQEESVYLDYFKKARVKHEILEENFSIETIAAIETNLKEASIPNSPLHENLKIIKSYLKAEAYHINKASNEWEEISATCHDINQQGKTVEIFRKYLNIQPQRRYSDLTNSPKRNLSGDDLPSFAKKLREAERNTSLSVFQDSEAFPTKESRISAVNISQTHDSIIRSPSDTPIITDKSVGKWPEEEVTSFINDYKIKGYLSEKSIKIIREKNGLSNEEKNYLAWKMYREYKKANDYKINAKEEARIYGYLNTYVEKSLPEDKSHYVENKYIIEEKGKWSEEKGKWSEEEMASFINDYKTKGHLSEENIKIIKEKNGLSKEEKNFLAKKIYREYKKAKGDKFDENERMRIYRYLENYTGEEAQRAKKEAQRAKKEAQRAEKEAQRAEKKAQRTKDMEEARIRNKAVKEEWLKKVNDEK